MNDFTKVTAANGVFNVGDTVRVLDPDLLLAASESIWATFKPKCTYGWVRNRPITKGVEGVIKALTRAKNGNFAAVIDVAKDVDGKSRAYIIECRGLESMMASAPATPAPPTAHTTPTPAPQPQPTNTNEKENDTMTATAKPLTLKDYLLGSKVPEAMIGEIQEFRKSNPVEDDYKERITPPATLFVGDKVLNMAISAILQGKNVILEGDKASGKNILASTLAFIFSRPVWNLSCHVHVDHASIIGTDTFKGGEVQFRQGHLVEAMKAGGFVVMDEWNFARPEAMAVMHSITDHRRTIDVPGYEQIEASPAFRVVATMNYGYAGTRELNEALTDRFVVIHVPQMDEKALSRFLMGKFPTLIPNVAKQFVGIFQDLQEKAKNAEVSSRSVSLRGLLDALECIRQGLRPLWAVEMCIINKSFDGYERKKVRDTVATRVPEAWTTANVFQLPKGSGIELDFTGVK